MKIYVLKSPEDVHTAWAYFARSHCVYERLEMTEFREVNV